MARRLTQAEKDEREREKAEAARIKAAEAAAKAAAKAAAQQAKIAQDKAFSDIDFAYKTGEISAQEYYSQLAVLRDRYFTVESAEWQQHTIKIHEFEQKTANEARKNEFDELEGMLKRKTISEQEYYDALASLRDKHFAVGTAEYEKYTNQILDYQAKSVEQQKVEIEKTFNQLVAATEKSLEQINKSEQAFAKKLDNYGELYHDQTIRIKTVDPADRKGKAMITETYTTTKLADLRKQVDELKEYNSLLDQIKERGEVPEEFIDTIIQMSIEDGMKFSEALLASDQQVFDDYLLAWQEKQDQVASLAAQRFRDSKIELLNKASEIFADVPEGFFDIGESSGNQFGDGFLSEVDKVLKQASDKVKASVAAMQSSINSVSSSSSTVYSTSTYNLIPTDTGTRSQLEAIARAETVKELRGN